MGWMVNAMPRPLYPWERDPVPIVWEAGWTPGSVWTGAENFDPKNIRFPDRPARSESLYCLRYPGPRLLYTDSKTAAWFWRIFYILLIYNSIPEGETFLWNLSFLSYSINFPHIAETKAITLFTGFLTNDQCDAQFFFLCIYFYL
jgi:hypothetical protein